VEGIVKSSLFASQENDELEYDVLASHISINDAVHFVPFHHLPFFAVATSNLCFRRMLRNYH
jgi:hypothetical protein